jgi:cobalt-zinc-cadmium efflux system membrane fusion protein
MTRIKSIQVVILLALPLFILSCSEGKNKAEAASVDAEEVLPEDIVELRADQIKLAKVEFGAAEMRTMGNSLKVNGVISVAPENRATVCMPMGGFIKSTNLLPGNPVAKGQVLAEIENQDFINIQQEYLESRNKLVFAEAEYKRHTDLFKNDVYSEQNLQQVTMEYRNLKAQVKSLEEKLKLIGVNPEKLTEDNISSTVYLTSPIKGYLKSVNVNLGKYVSPEDVLFEVVNGDKLFLELTLYEKDADKIVKGQKARFFINNEDEAHEAVITQAGRTISDDKTFRAYASVTSSCTNLLPGMYVNVVVESSGSKVVAVPSDAVVSFDDKDYIFIFEKDKTEAGFPFTEYRMIEVRKGVSAAGFTEIRVPEGFDATSVKIVTKGAYNLLSAKKNAGEMAC